MLPIKLYREVSSTNDLALQGAREVAPHGTCWVADAQTAGRGRRQVGGQRREWFSPSGKSIYMSVLLRPKLPAAQASGITLAAGIGVCEALRHEIADLDIWLKWPNDIFIGDKKLGGILTEAVTGSSGELDAIVVGVGLNINVETDDVPEELRPIMTSVAIEYGPFDRMSLLQPLRDAIIAWCDAYAHRGFDTIGPALERFDKSDGHRVTVDNHGSLIEGTARGIDPEGRLRVELADGSVKALHTGEVTLLPQGK